VSLLIKNAMIVNADEQMPQARDILIEKGVIIKIAASIKEENVKIVDAKNRFVMPGFVDLHVHLREPGREDKETIETGSRAAAKGGFTTIMCMPNTNPVIDNCMVVEAIVKEAKRIGLVNVVPIGSITKGQKQEELTDMFEMKKAGCLALSEDGRSVESGQLMRLALEYAQMVGILLIDHCQDASLFCKGVVNEGEVSTLLGLKGDPAISETVVVARDIEMANYLKTKIHLAHISLKRSVDLIRMAKKQGIKITAEVCPHHFSLTQEDVKTFNTHTKVNPPLRAKEDVDAIKKGIKDGTIDSIASDHAPHTIEDKELDFDHAPFGMIGLETSAGLAISELVEPGVLTWPQFVEKMSFAPAKIVGLDNKGCLREGLDADIVIVDPELEWEVVSHDFASKSKNSPFIGRKLKGRVVTTICNGKIVYEL